MTTIDQHNLVQFSIISWQEKLVEHILEGEETEVAHHVLARELASWRREKGILSEQHQYLVHQPGAENYRLPKKKVTRTD